MLIETIDVPVVRNGKDEGTRPLLALCDDLFAISADGIDEDAWQPLFRLTHRPTGRAVSGPIVWEYALGLLSEIRRRGYDRWRFTDVDHAKTLGAEWTDIQATVRMALGGIWLGEPAPGFQCLDCGHRHAGERMAFICVGCPCPRTSLESATTDPAVDPVAANQVEPPTRDSSSSSSSEQR